MFEITKEFAFEAAHHLKGLPEGHPCSRVHGHSYRVRVTMASAELDATGFVADFAELAPLDEFVRTTLDHRDLNEVLDVQPSSELLARWLFTWCRTHLPAPVADVIAAVAVSETRRSWAVYRPQDDEGAGK